MTKQHPHLDMVRVLRMLFYYLLSANITSTDNTKYHPSNDTDDKTIPSFGNG